MNEEAAHRVLCCVLKDFKKIMLTKEMHCIAEGYGEISPGPDVRTSAHCEQTLMRL